MYDGKSFVNYRRGIEIIIDHSDVMRFFGEQMSDVLEELNHYLDKSRTDYLFSNIDLLMIIKIASSKNL